MVKDNLPLIIKNIHKWNLHSRSLIMQNKRNIYKECKRNAFACIILFAVNKKFETSNPQYTYTYISNIHQNSIKGKISSFFTHKNEKKILLSYWKFLLFWLCKNAHVSFNSFGVKIINRYRKEVM